MKFFGKGYLWDKARETMLCQFKDGVYETEDDREIAILQQNGYESEFGNVEVGDEIVISDAEEVDIDELEELKALCKEMGLKGYGNIKDIDKLKTFIAERE